MAWVLENSYTDKWQEALAICHHLSRELCRDGRMSWAGGTFAHLASDSFCRATEAHGVGSTTEMYCFTVLEFWDQGFKRLGFFWELWRILPEILVDCWKSMMLFIEVSSNFCLHIYTGHACPNAPLPCAFHRTQVRLYDLLLCFIHLNLLETLKPMLPNTLCAKVLGAETSAHEFLEDTTQCITGS